MLQDTATYKREKTKEKSRTKLGRGKQSGKGEKKKGNESKAHLRGSEKKDLGQIWDDGDQDQREYGPTALRGMLSLEDDHGSQYLRLLLCQLLFQELHMY